MQQYSPALDLAYLLIYTLQYQFIPSGCRPVQHLFSLPLCVCVCLCVSACIYYPRMCVYSTGRTQVTNVQNNRVSPPALQFDCLTSIAVVALPSVTSLHYITQQQTHSTDTHPPSVFFCIQEGSVYTVYFSLYLRFTPAR